MACALHADTDAAAAAVGYLGHDEWATRMTITHRQTLCPGCGRYRLWVPWTRPPFPQRMSCWMTLDAVRSKTKTVTRRAPHTWQRLAVGDRLVLIEKGQGVAKGQRQQVLDVVWVTSVTVEPLAQLWVERDATAREGVPDMTPAQFARWWADNHQHRDTPTSELGAVLCRRIAWTYTPPET